MIKIIRTDSKNEDFIQLVKELDSYLKITDGDEHDFYNQFNGIDVLDNVIIAYLNNKPIGCGAFKELDSSSIEVKRMYTKPIAREKGIATKILKTLEIWALELKYSSCVLETGIRQEEAVQFYKKKNYTIIPNYGQYKNMNNSLCFEKKLI
ncbi:GNAT family N-acetyltransferase [Flavobacteriales bacterium 33_180_T64]|nr:GNAT family N-acetyltransferase [Flavobacteriales bacterium 33_180_T64]